MPRVAASVDVALALAPGPGPMRRKVADAVIAAVEQGLLRPGDFLPPSRSLAQVLQIPRRPVVEAYAELVGVGFATATPGGRTVVAADAGTARSMAPPTAPLPSTEREPVEARPPLRWNLLAGLPDASLIPLDDWTRSWRSATKRPPAYLVLPDDQHRPLREALADHLRRTRGIVADPDEIFVVPGVGAAVRALAVAAELRGRTVAFEEPGYLPVDEVLRQGGVATRPVAVDLNGLDTDRLTDSDQAVYLTPAHQFPLGERLSVSRRAAVLDWARATGGLIIEDDYDGEFRYDIRPTPPLAGTPDGRDLVAYIGTASKMLSPVMRVAWLIPPRRLTRAVASALLKTGDAASPITTDALAHFIVSGALSRHLSRATRTYSARRTALAQALRQTVPVGHIRGIHAGLHLVVDLPAEVPTPELKRRLREQGLALDVLHHFFRGEPTVNGLVCGYAVLPESQAPVAAGRIAAAVLTALRTGRTGPG